MNIAILSGEISGDLVGGELAKELRALSPDVKLWGLGSSAMQSQGVELLEDSSKWGAIGIIRSLMLVPNFLIKIAPKIKAALKERRPDVVVLIDFGAFNVRMAKYCKKLGLKVVYLIPPGCWRKNSDKGQELKELTDLLLVPFPWALERYRKWGAKAEFVGHPILDRVQPKMTRQEFADHFGMSPDAPIIGLLPGSRLHEVEHIMPAMLDATRLIYREVKNAQFVVGVAPNISIDMMRKYLSGHEELVSRLAELWHEFVEEADTKVWKPLSRAAKALEGTPDKQMVTNQGFLVNESQFREQLKQQSTPKPEEPLPPTILAKGLTYEVMAHSDILLVCSGTATLEAAILEKPMVIMYRYSRLMEIEVVVFGMRKKIPLIGLPNILSGTQIVPELIQEDATPEAISNLAVDMLQNVEKRSAIRADLRALRSLLGEPGACKRSAKLVMDVINNKYEESNSWNVNS